MDPCIMNYTVVATLSGYGFALFVWWWRKWRRATLPYIYFTFLLLGICINHGLMIYARWKILGMDYEEMDGILHSFWWEMRSVPLAVILILICAHFSWRAFVMGRRVNTPVTSAADDDD